MKAGIYKIAEGNLTSGCGGGRKVKRAVIVIPPTEAEEQTRMHPHTNEGLEGASGTHPFLDKALHHRRPVTTTATETPSFRKMRPAMKYRTCPRRGQSRIRKGNHKLHRIEERFTELSHFASRLIANEADKCSWRDCCWTSCPRSPQLATPQLVEAAGSARLGG